MDCVVYEIVNTKNGKRYFGSTCSFHNRKLFHVKSLDRGDHFNQNLQRDWTKRKGIGFEINVIRRFNSRNKAYKLESELIDSSNPKKIYNILRGRIGGDVLTHNPRREDIIEKHRKHGLELSQKEINRRFRKFGEDNPNWRGGSSLKLCSCGNKMAYTAKTCAECYDKTGENNPFYGKKHSRKTKKLLADASRGKVPGNARPVKIGRRKFVSMGEASRELGIPVPTILWRVNSNNEKYEKYSFINA